MCKDGEGQVKHLVYEVTCFGATGKLTSPDLSRDGGITIHFWHVDEHF